MPPRDDSNNTRQLVGEINGKLDQLLRSIDRHFEDDRINFAALNTRVTSVDDKVDKVSSKVAWFSGMWAAVVLVVGYIFKGH